MTGIILAAVIVLLAIVLIWSGIVVVPQSETRVIERLGRFHAVLSPGLNFIIPLSTVRSRFMPARWCHRVSAARR